jgi:hypothetical protein
MEKKKVSQQSINIPQGNIDTYFSWYKTLKEVQEMNFEEFDFNEPQEILRNLQRCYNLGNDWFYAAYKPINIKQCERADLFNPFLPVWHFMRYGKITHKVPYKELWPNSLNMGKGFFKLRDHSKKREGADTKTNWALNVLFCAMVEDCHWYGNGRKYSEAQSILEGLPIEETNMFDYDTFSHHCKRIDHIDINELLERLCKACAKANKPFISSGVSISEWPTDFLANIAHFTKYKKNPYISGEKHLTEEMRKNLKPHLQQLLTKRTQLEK